MNLFLATALLDGQTVFLKSSLIILYLILAALALSCLVFTFIMVRSPLEGNTPKLLMVFLYLVTAFVLISAIICTDQFNKLTTVPNLESSVHNTTTTPNKESPESTTTPNSEPGNNAFAYYTNNTAPSNWNIKWDVMQNSNVFDSYSHPDTIIFGDANSYTTVAGITTFRGNHYRNSASYGIATIIDKTISEKWCTDFEADNNQTGCSWTGQPLIIRWNEAEKANMNLMDGKKEKATLVEVICVTSDGNIYFYDLDDGTPTREPIRLGMNFTCAGALDPRGYPLLYLGASDGESKTPRIYVISLIDGKVLYEQSGSDIDAYHRQFSFDSAPLISAEADTLIWPCESGILYFIKLNTQYTKETGTISVKPENMVKLRYKSEPYTEVGTASSPVAVDHYLYLADNAGMVFCIDLTTMDLIWAQSIGDQVRSTPVFEGTVDGDAYLYTATTSVSDKTSCNIYKLDAHTGEIVWTYTIANVKSSSSIPGGVLATPLLGAPNTTLDGMIIINVAKSPTSNSGTLLALDTTTGSLIWEIDLDAYSWSSPIALYTSDGTGYIIACDSQGTVALYEAATGNLLDSQSTQVGIEASPVAFENTIVIATSKEKIFSFEVE